jgi:hypothetical protein
MPREPPVTRAVRPASENKFFMKSFRFDYDAVFAD